MMDPCTFQENNCKVFKIILHDLEGNWCEMMAFSVSQHAYGVVTTNVASELAKAVLMIME